MPRRDEELPPDGEGPKLKRTFYLDRDSVMTLSEIQAKEFRATGHKPDLSDLIARGIQLLSKATR